MNIWNAQVLAPMAPVVFAWTVAHDALGLEMELMFVVDAIQAITRNVTFPTFTEVWEKVRVVVPDVVGDVTLVATEYVVIIRRSSHPWQCPRHRQLTRRHQKKRESIHRPR